MSIEVPSSVDADYAATEEARFRDYLVNSEGATELLRSLVALDEFKPNRPTDATQWLRAKTGSQDLSCLVRGVEAPDVRAMVKENAKLKQKLQVYTEQLQKLALDLGPRLGLGAFRTPIATEPPLDAWLPEYVVRKANVGRKIFSLCTLCRRPNPCSGSPIEEKAPGRRLVRGLCSRVRCAEAACVRCADAARVRCADAARVCVLTQPTGGSSPTASRARPTHSWLCLPSTASIAAKRSGCFQKRSMAYELSLWIGLAMAIRTSRPASTGTPSRRPTCSSSS